MIACANYGGGWPRLPNPVRDAREVKAALEKLGFKVDLVENADSAKLNRALSGLPGGPGTDPQLGFFIFFAGHGHTLEKFDGTKLGYIVPVDAPDPDKDYAGFLEKAISMEKLEQISNLIRSKHVLFAFDSCFAGSIFRASNGRPSPFIQEQVTNPVRAFVTAGTENERVPDESVFKTVLIQGLTDRYADRNRDGYVTGEELGAYLREEVINYTGGAQHPQFGKINNPKLDKGDFIFVLGEEKDESGLAVETIPPGARVTIGGIAKGNSPLIDTRLPPGNVLVEVELEGYEPAEMAVIVREGRQTPVRLTLTPSKAYGSLKVESDPAGAQWYLDGAYGGLTPDSIPRVETGAHQVTLKAPGFQEWQGHVEVVPEKEVSVAARLVPERPRKGRLFVRTEPVGAQVRILNGDYSFRQGMELDPGEYQVEVGAEGYDKELSRVSLAPGEDKTLDVRLPASPATPDIVSESREPEVSPAARAEKIGEPSAASRLENDQASATPRKEDPLGKIVAFPKPMGSAGEQAARPPVQPAEPLPVTRIEPGSPPAETRKKDGWDKFAAFFTGKASSGEKDPLKVATDQPLPPPPASPTPSPRSTAGLTRSISSWAILPAATRFFREPRTHLSYMALTSSSLSSL